MPTVLSITDATLTLGVTGTPDFSDQVTQAQINASPNLETVPATLQSPESQIPAATSYELEINWLQDWHSPGGGLSKWAFDNDTLEATFSLTLTGAATPAASGTIRVVAGAFGGEAGTPLQTSATLPIQGKPTITTPAVV